MTEDKSATSNPPAAEQDKPSGGDTDASPAVRWITRILFILLVLQVGWLIKLYSAPPTSNIRPPSGPQAAPPGPRPVAPPPGGPVAARPSGGPIAPPSGAPSGRPAPGSQPGGPPGDPRAMAPPVSTGPAGTSKGYGEIKVLSADEHKISFAHEGVPDLKLAAGTTSFKLSPSVKLEGISVGTSCDFYVDKSSGEMVVVAFGFGPSGSEPAPGGPPPPSGIPQGGGGPGPAASGAPAPPPPSGGPQAGAPPPSGGPRPNPPPPGGPAAGAPPPAGKPQPGAPPPSGAPQPKQP